MHATCSIVSVFPWDICKMSNRVAKCIYHVLKIKRPFQCPNKKNLGCQRRGGDLVASDQIDFLFKTNK